MTTLEDLPDDLALLVHLDGATLGPFVSPAFPPEPQYIGTS